MSATDVAEHWMQLAEKATGKTREELLREAEEDPVYGGPIAITVDPVQQRRRRMKLARVPERHIRNVADAEPAMCPPLDSVQRFFANPDGGILILSGDNGTQKTGSACWMLGQVEGGQYLEADDLLSIAFRDPARWDQLLRARHVVLDELGLEDVGEKGEAYWIRRLAKLVNAWYAAHAHVVVTCNLSKPEIMQRYGSNIRDRLAECGTFVAVGGSSVRGRQ